MWFWKSEPNAKTIDELDAARVEFAQEHESSMWKFDPSNGHQVRWQIYAERQGARFDTETGEMVEPGTIRVHAEGLGPRRGGSRACDWYFYDPNTRTVRVERH